MPWNPPGLCRQPLIRVLCNRVPSDELLPIKERNSAAIVVVDSTLLVIGGDNNGDILA
jgi:hypothetical protein